MRPARQALTATRAARSLPLASLPLPLPLALPRSALALSNSRSFNTTPSPRNTLKRTALYDFHLSHRAKMVPFAGFSMPLSYGDIGQVAAHNHVRTQAGLFDVSHMLQHRFSGADAEAFLQSLTPASLAALKPFSSTLSVLLNETGGIIDDTIITKHSSTDFYVVTNAGRIAKDTAHITAQLEAQKWDVTWETLDRGLLALQGPSSVAVLQPLTPSVDLADMSFGQAAYANIDGARCHIARGGYTGEDGFEISIPLDRTADITARLVADPAVQLIGLGARDSLRLEAGMCLYGHDLDESVSPVEAGLTWVVGKDRRAAADFPGAARILKEIADGPARRRVGFELSVPAREGCKVYSKDGQEIGVITSGIPSPTLGTNIAMGYIKNGQHKKGTAVQIEVRKKMRDAVVRSMPFVPSKYYKGKGAAPAPA